MDFNLNLPKYVVRPGFLIPMINTIFFGSSKYSIIVLKKLIESDYFDIKACVSQSDEKTSNPVHKFASKHNIRSIRTQTLEGPRQTSLSAQLKAGTAPSFRQISSEIDIGIVAYFGLLIPEELFNLAKYGYINVHPSLLPKYKGAVPAEAAILNRDKETGVTLLKITEKFDEGLIIAQEKVMLSGAETKSQLYKTLFTLGSKLLVSAVPEYIKGEIKPKPQKGKGSYLPKIKKEAGRIDWLKPDDQIEAMVRAYEGWPGTFTTLKELVKVNNPIIQLSNNSESKLVKILKAHLEGGKLAIDELQIEGKNPMSWQAFENGYL